MTSFYQTILSARGLRNPPVQLVESSLKERTMEGHAALAPLEQDLESEPQRFDSPDVLPVKKILPDIHEPENTELASTFLKSNASYFPPSSAAFRTRGSILSGHSDLATRPANYNQLIDYLDMLSVPLITMSNISLGKELGIGATFSVREAELHNQMIYTSLVAVKTPRESVHKGPTILHAVLREVLDEVRVMSHLSGHPNIATLHGVILESKAGGLFLPRLVMERAVGSLGTLLRRASSGVPWNLKLKFCLETAAGLEALHRIQIVHSDVKADNILVFHSSEQWEQPRAPQLVAKVSDFGFCVPDTSSRAGVAAKGTLRFKAPEALPEAPPHLQAYANMPYRDIYSFGVLLWEVLSDGRLPFEDLRDQDVIDLQLSSEDGASRHLAISHNVVDSEFRNLESFLDVIHGTVRRQPVGSHGRIAWQEVYELLTSAIDTSSMISPDPQYSFAEYFVSEHGRQRPVAWTVFQQTPWLPLAPSPTMTWQTSEAYAELVMSELESLSRTEPHDWIATIRLALHYFQVGDTNRMREFLELFAECSGDFQEEFAGTFLHAAVKLNALDVIRAMLSKSVNPNVLDVFGRTPLHMAQSAAAAQALIERGADVNARLWSQPEEPCPLHFAASAEVAEVLLKNGADIHSVDRMESTPLHTALSAEVVEVLVRYGADPLVNGTVGTPLHRAFSNDVALALMDICPAALQALNRFGQTPLHSCIDDWTAETVKHAFALGADANALDAEGWTPLAHCRSNSPAAFTLVNFICTPTILPRINKSSPLHQIVDPDLMEICLQNGYSAFVDWKDRLGQTALHIVANRDSALLNSWADRLGQLPYVEKHWRPWSPTGTAHLLSRSSHVRSIQLMTLLLSHNANPNIPDRKGNTPLHYVARNLIGYDGHEDSIALLRLLLRSGADLNAQNDFGETPLHSAGRAETVAVLLEAGANPKMKDEDGVTILHNVSRFGGSCHKVVSALVTRGADLEAEDNEGLTPLHYACRSYESGSKAFVQLERWIQLTNPTNRPGVLIRLLEHINASRLEAIAALLDQGAGVNAVSKSGSTPLHLLSKQPFARDAYQLLLSHVKSRYQLTAHNESFEDIDEANCPKDPWWN